MRTLYLRNVPDEVVARLERLASQNGLSMNALAVRELTEASRRADNAGLLATLPAHQVDPAGILADVEAERAPR